MRPKVRVNSTHSRRLVNLQLDRGPFTLSNQVIVFFSDGSQARWRMADADLLLNKHKRNPDEKASID